MKKINLVERLGKIGETLSILALISIGFGIILSVIMFTVYPDQMFTQSRNFIGMENVEPLMTKVTIFSIGFGIASISLAIMIGSLQKKLRKYAREHMQAY